ASQEQVAQQVRQQRLSNAAAEAAFDEQARQTLATVNLYLGPVADTILQHDGTLNKFIGDCIMAFWGAPTPNPRHALSCVRAAIEAQRAIDALNQQRAAENQRRTAENQARLAAGRPPLPLLPILRLGTGINTGMATVGLMGSDHAVVRQGDYTAFGREVNLASRLEGASGHGRIFISEATYEHLRRDDPVLAASCLALAPMAVKGFRTPVQVFEVPWLVGTPKPEIRRELATRHSRCRRAGWWLRALWLGGWLCVAPLWAAPPQTAFDVWQVADSWQQNTVSTIAQSHQGYLWLGTYHGLVRFDGVRFTVFDSSNTRGLCNGLITSLYEDPQGVLWIGHETGQLSRLSRGEFQPVPLGPTWPGGTVETISSDESGDLWLLNTSGVLFRVRDGHAVLCPGGASPGRKAALTRASDGKLWIVSNGQVAALDHGKVVPYSFPEATASDYYERVLPARDGGLWVLGNQRLRKWSEDRWSDELEACPRGAGAVTALWETRSGALLVGTLKEGLYVLTPGAASQRFSRANGLSQDWVRTLWEDHEGNIWIGTGAGLDGLRPRKVQMLNAPDGWQGCAVLSFSLRQDGSAWIGTEGAGLYRYQHQQWTTFGESSGLTNSFVWSVFETRQRQLLVGTWGGGLLVEQGEHFAATNPFAQLSAPVVAIFQSRNGDLWMGTTSGLFRYRGGKLLWSATKDQLAMPDVRAITQTPDGTLYFGMSGGGLGAFKRGVLRQFRKEDGLGSDFVVTLHADADDTLWIGTSDHGLTRLKQGKFATLSLEQGLPSNVILQ
ncbi:MAG TPA: two-component regulator propeller domain-containing protein, partial [Bacillota bacterium]|nr:two-component regulator propeller domain-containing protein [Bacillota bacterium]